MYGCAREQGWVAGMETPREFLFFRGRKQTNGWYPIEVAPKDGTVILAYCEGEESFVLVSWKAHYWTGEYAWTQCYVDGPDTYDDLTHWQPLPQPPETIQKARTEKTTVEAD
jgi:hypothetical protein